MAAMISTTVAAQTTLNDMSNRFGGRTPLRVYFLDNSSKLFLVDSHALCKDVIFMILEKFGVHDVSAHVPYFGIYTSLNGNTLDHVISIDDNIVDVVQSWNNADAAKLVFMIRLFMPCIWGLEHRDIVALEANKPKNLLALDTYLEAADIIDENLIHLQYIQAVYHVITGQYPTTVEQALHLGSIHFFYKFGSYHPDRHRPGFLGSRIVEFIPIKHLKHKSMEQWENELFDAIREHHDDKEDSQNSVSQQRKYMEQVYRMQYYGCTFFRVSQRVTKALPDTLIIGIQTQGIMLLEKTRKLIRNFRIEEILRWGFTANVLFYFEITPNKELGTGTLEFETKEGEVISDLLTDYALAFLKEKDREEERLEAYERGEYGKGMTRKAEYDQDEGEEGGRYGEEREEEEEEEEEERGYYGRDYAHDKNSAAARKSVSFASEAAASVNSRNNVRDNNNNNNTNSSLGPVPKVSMRVLAIIIKMQAMYRGYALRRDWLREDAAILIQSAYRGYRSRLLLSDMIERLLASAEYEAIHGRYR